MCYTGIMSKGTWLEAEAGYEWSWRVLPVIMLCSLSTQQLSMLDKARGWPRSRAYRIVGRLLHDSKFCPATGFRRFWHSLNDLSIRTDFRV